MRKLGNESQTIEEFLDGVLPHDHPHVQLYWDVTPLWHGGESPDELDDRNGEGYSCGFSGGFESGIVMAVMKPEWAVGWYQRVRQYYLTHNHPPEDLQSWQRCAEETARAMPVVMTTMVTQTPHPPSIVSQSQALATEDLQ